MAAQITINQSGGAGPGTPGEARKDIWLAQAVQLVSSGTGSTFLWELLDKPASSVATLSTPTASSSGFTPDQVGTYRVRLSVDGGGAGNVVTLVIRVRYTSTGVLTRRGWAMPAVEEFDTENNYGGNDRGWAEVWEGIIPEVSKALTTLVYREAGGTNAGHVFDDWPTLMETFSRIDGIVEIMIDGPGANTIPAGTWDLERRAHLVGKSLGSPYSLTLANGASIEDPLSIKRLAVTVTGTNVGSIVLNAGAHFFAEDATFLNGSSAGPLLTVDLADMTLRGSCALAPLTAQPVVLFSPGITSRWTIEDASTVATDVMAGTPTSVIVDLIGVSASCSGTQTAFAGSLTINAPLVPEPYTFIFRPGYSGPSQPNIYTVWADLMTDLDAVDGPKVVQFDNTDGAITIPSGTWDFGYETTLRGTDEGALGTGVPITVAGILHDVYALDQGLIVRSSAARSIFTWRYDGSNTPLVLHMDNGAEIDTGGATFSPISLGSGFHLIISMKRGSALRRTGAIEVVELTHASADLKVYMHDQTFNFGDVIDAAVGTATVYLVGGAAVWNHSASAGLTVERMATRRWVYSLTKSNITEATGTPVIAGAAYVDPQEFPSFNWMGSLGLTAKFRVVIETTAPGQAAVVDLFDTNGVFNAGTPIPVAGSQQDTATGTPPARPFGATPVTPNPLVASAYEVDLSSVFIGGTWTGAGVFEARLWIATAGGGNVATCKSAELIFEW